MPAYQVEDRIASAIRATPLWVDHLLVVDDGCTDHTVEIIKALQHPGLALVRHETNRGVGAAIQTGYDRALELGAEIIAVMAGDGQMDGNDLATVVEPLVARRADYVKGNRFLHPAVWRQMPFSRIVGNVVLSLLTKISSGYWRLFDSQCGYTAITREALLYICSPLFARYGYLNDLLARLHLRRARVEEVCVRPIYEGQRSGITLGTVLHPILSVVFRSFARRLWRQHLKPFLRRVQRSLPRPLPTTSSKSNAQLPPG
jgi:glycosyltransferase involved in cell wall biosynthesis